MVRNRIIYRMLGLVVLGVAVPMFGNNDATSVINDEMKQTLRKTTAEIIKTAQSIAKINSAVIADEFVLATKEVVANAQTATSSVKSALNTAATSIVSIAKSIISRHPIACTTTTISAIACWYAYKTFKPVLTKNKFVESIFVYRCKPTRDLVKQEGSALVISQSKEQQLVEQIKNEYANRVYKPVQKNLIDDYEKNFNDLLIGYINRQKKILLEKRDALESRIGYTVLNSIIGGKDGKIVIDNKVTMLPEYVEWITNATDEGIEQAIANKLRELQRKSWLNYWWVYNCSAEDVFNYWRVSHLIKWSEYLVGLIQKLSKNSRPQATVNVPLQTQQQPPMTQQLTQTTVQQNKGQ